MKRLMRRNRINTYDRFGYSVTSWSWGPWESLGTSTDEKSEKSLKVMRELNDFAVSKRGEEARAEFKLEEV